MQGLALQGQVLCRSGKIATHLLFWLSSLPPFLALCLAILVPGQSLFNSSVEMAMKFDHKCKNLSLPSSLITSCI